MDTTGAMALPEAANRQADGATKTLEFAVPSQPNMISDIRHRVCRFARALSFTPEELDDIAVAVGEAATNAVKYGRDGSESPLIRVRLEAAGGAFRVLVSDTGPGFDPATVCPPGFEDLKECGRGIFCMASLMDELAFHKLDPGTCVEMVKRVRS